MSDPQLPPPDPDEVERDENESVKDDPAIAGVGPALFVPPVPGPTPEPDDEDAPDEES